jgi:hypothetical protein
VADLCEALRAPRGDVRGVPAHPSRARAAASSRRGRGRGDSRPMGAGARAGRCRSCRRERRGLHERGAPLHLHRGDHRLHQGHRPPPGPSGEPRAGTARRLGALPLRGAREHAERHAAGCGHGGGAPGRPGAQSHPQGSLRPDDPPDPAGARHAGRGEGAARAVGPGGALG